LRLWAVGTMDPTASASGLTDQNRLETLRNVHR
jgi:hypothetical protein